MFGSQWLPIELFCRPETTLNFPDKPISERTCVADSIVIGILDTEGSPDKDNVACYRSNLDAFAGFTAPAGNLYEALFAVEHTLEKEREAIRQLHFDLYSAQRQRSQLGLPREVIHGMTCIKSIAKLYPSWTVQERSTRSVSLGLNCIAFESHLLSDPPAFYLRWSANA